MQLSTFLRQLDAMPTRIRHDRYEDKDILEFEKKDGYFPYIEFQAQPKDKKQLVYFDILNWDADGNDRYVSECFQNAHGFMKMFYLDSTNQFSTIDQINSRIHAFNMLMDSRKQ